MGPPRHIVFFDAYPHMHTGTARSALLLAQWMPHADYTAQVVLPGPGIVADRAEEAGVDVAVVPAGAALGHYGRSTRGVRIVAALLALPGFWWRLRRHLRARPGIVHVTSHRSVLLAGPAARLARLPVVWQISGIEDDRAVSRICGWLATKTIAISSAAAAGTLPRARRPAIVPPPLDPRFDDVATAEPRHPPVVVTTGRLEPVKDHRLLLSAFAAVLDHAPDARLRIVGGDQLGHEAYAADIRRAAAALGSSGTVEITGWTDHPESCLHDASVYVSTSRTEGLGLAIVEAMAVGLPVVFTASTGLAEFVEHEHSALIVPAEAHAVAGAVLRVLEDGALAARLGAAGREASRRFALDRVGPDLAAVFDDVLVPAPAAS